jgi:hypothetical protein
LAVSEAVMAKNMQEMRTRNDRRAILGKRA